MYCKLKSFAFRGVEVLNLEIEVTISARGIPRVDVTGVRGSEWLKNIKKIRTAFGNLKIPFPNKKITVNFGPQGVLKDIADAEFPIAMGILFAQSERGAGTSDLFYGSLDSSGCLTPSVKTIFLNEGWSLGKRGRIFLPKGSYFFSEGDTSMNFFEIASLREAKDFFEGVAGVKTSECHFMSYDFGETAGVEEGSFDAVLGNSFAKRALTISIAGKHNILLLGPSGTGKSLLAGQYPGLMPEPGREVIIERAKAAALCGTPMEEIVRTPYRSPHISAKESEIVGNAESPGEVTLAHGGILFLDEMHLYPGKVLNSLKTVLDRKEVEFNSGGFPVRYPADFLLIGAANNCMCGLAGSPEKQCKCTGGDINTYNSRISPALLERFDIVAYVAGSPVEAVQGVTGAGSNMSAIRKQIKTAAEAQRKRAGLTGVPANSRIPFDKIDSACILEKEAPDLLEMAVRKLDLSTRSVHRIKAVSRTIADLDGVEKISPCHVAEAIQYRVKNDKP